MPTIKQLHVNGTPRAVAADSRRSLLSVLRDDLDLTGCKYGCGEGRCGACTVLVDGRAIRSCTTPVGAAAGKKIQTIEGLASDGKFHPLQEAFLEAGALQCGYCTPGMILSALGLLQKDTDPSREEIARHMNVNVCRCGVYGRIVTAIEKAAEKMKGGDK
jgi:nicotinate dehydrogenase subunit A